MADPADLEQLSERERQVLNALVDAHISTGEPIGSKVLADAGDLQVSPQTIRNVLSALHERGLIAQPHTSAGRVPTDLGFRYYVDSLVRFTPPAQQVQGEIASRLEDAGGVDHALREAARVLSRLVQQTCVVLAPPVAQDRVRHLELVRLRDDAVLFIVVSIDGRVQNRLFEWRDGPAPTSVELHSAAVRLTALLFDKTLEEGRTVLDAAVNDTRSALTRVEERLMALSRDGVTALLPDPAVHVDGTSHLVAPTDDENVRQQQKKLLLLLDEQQRVRALFDGAARGPGVRIFIGAENPAAALSQAGVVTASVGAGGAIGLLGVIGPRHLDYRRVVPLVDATAAIITRLLG